MSALSDDVAGEADERFGALAERFVAGYPSLHPVAATRLGDHRFDGSLDEIGDAARREEGGFYRRFLTELDAIRREELSRDNQVDAALLRHELRASLWRLESLQEWAWNPLVYTELTGGAVYSLIAREFAPLPERLAHVAERLEQFPRLLAQVRATLEPDRVPKDHAETAVRQNRGVLSILDAMVQPRLAELDGVARERLGEAMATARAAVDEHQRWLEEQLLPRATGDFRLGCALYESKLAFSLNTPLSRGELRARAQRELARVRDEMYAVASRIYLERHPWTEIPRDPDRAYRQAITRAALETAYARLPRRDEIVDVARRQLAQATAFVRDRELVTLPEDPIEIIVMPEFQRGVSVAYCDPPGPLDTGQRTFYAVSPLPEGWTDDQVRSFLREYNLYSLQDLTVHEAMPGHHLQLAHANRHPSRLRRLLASGTFIEGWAVYAEQLMVAEGYNGADPRQKLITLKWLLRSITNALMDQAIHCDGMSRDAAMRLMVEDGFQEEREAALKWVRAQLTSAQLSTYFVGYQEHVDLRESVERVWGEAFAPRRYHDFVLSFGSPPVRFVRALMLDEPIPREASGP